MALKHPCSPPVFRPAPTKAQLEKMIADAKKVHRDYWDDRKAAGTADNVEY